MVDTTQTIFWLNAEKQLHFCFESVCYFDIDLGMSSFLVILCMCVCVCVCVCMRVRVYVCV